MKTYNITCLCFLVLLMLIGCNKSSDKILEKSVSPIIKNNESLINQKFNKYEPENTFGYGFFGDTIEKFDIVKYNKLLESDSVKKAILYLQTNKPIVLDSTNSNSYKSNLSNALIRQGKFDHVIKLLSEVISSETISNTIPERLLRSETYVQTGHIEKAMNDLNIVIEVGGRYKWRAYRQRGIIKYEILGDTIGGCEDITKGSVNDYTIKNYRNKYCN